MQTLVMMGMHAPLMMFVPVECAVVQRSDAQVPIPVSLLHVIQLQAVYSHPTTMHVMMGMHVQPMTRVQAVCVRALQSLVIPTIPVLLLRVTRPLVVC